MRLAVHGLAERAVHGLCTLLLATAIPTQEPTDVREAATLVRALGGSNSDGARAELEALGAAAVGALLDDLGTNRESTRHLSRRLETLRALAPFAGHAFDQLQNGAKQHQGPCGEDYLKTLAAIAPYRPKDARLDPMVFLSVLMGTGMLGDDARTARIALIAERLSVRIELHADAPIEDLVQLAESYRPFQVEAAIELLLHRGADARVALPVLRAIAARPNPRILLSDESVDLRRVAARAILALDPEAQDARDLRGILLGEPMPTAPLSRTHAELLHERAFDLLTKVRDKSEGDLAMRELQALGAMAVPCLMAAVRTGDPSPHEGAALEVLALLGSDAAAAVPHLVQTACAVEPARRPAILLALAATMPWCRDLAPSLRASPASGCFIHDRNLCTGADPATKAQIEIAFHDLLTAAVVDPGMGTASVERWLQMPVANTRRIALRIALDRAPELRGEVATMLACMEEEVDRSRWELLTDEATQQRWIRDYRILAARAVVANAAVESAESAIAARRLAELQRR